VGSAGLVVAAAGSLLFLRKPESAGELRIAETTEVRRPWMHSRVLWRIVAAIAVWSFFVGGFPPFFNVFFSKEHGQSLASIGAVSSLSQLCQVLAVFLMPVVVSRLGKVAAIFAMQLAAALCLSLLALARQFPAAAVIYLSYLSFQVMCEPALENFIMDTVTPKERHRASSVRYTTHFIVQSAAVWTTGLLIERSGYSILLVFLAGIGALAAFCFYACFREPVTTQRSAIS
jgi:predicted MFS family arabinose efflux permease